MNYMVLVEEERKELESKFPDLKIFDSFYCKLAGECKMTRENVKQLAGKAKALIDKWYQLHKKLKEISDNASKINKLRDQFIHNHSNAIYLLTSISARLIQAELVQNCKRRFKKIIELEKELERRSGCLRLADESGLMLMKVYPDEQENVSMTQAMIDEYQIMWTKLRRRIIEVKLVSKNT